MAEATRLIIIGGSPRSGTTLVQNILDSHPDVLGGPEFLHLPDIVRLRNKLHGSISRDWISLICSREDVDKRTRTMIEDLLLPFAERGGARILSEKTPENVLVFSELAELLPDARLLHVVRDPRAIVASLLEVGNRGRRKGIEAASFTHNVRAAIQHVRRSFRGGFKAVAEYPDRILTLRYEDLVTSPEAGIRKICAFTGMSWSDAMLTPAAQKHIGEQAITVNSNELWYDADKYNSNPHTSSLDKWKSTLSTAQHLAVLKAFENDENLSKLGYNLSSGDLGATDRLIGTLANTADRLGSGALGRLKKLAR